MSIDEIRNNTPGCKKVIHFNNAGAALVSQETLQIQQEYLKEEALWGGYEMAAKYSKELADGYNVAAKFLNAKPTEIAFTESATVAWIRSFFALNLKDGDEIICDATSYASNYIAFLNRQKRIKYTIKVAHQTADGEVDTDHLESSISNRTRLISITHIPTNSGLVNPAEAIGDIAKKHGILYQLDACQSAGQYPLDVKKLKCDMLSTTGRKYLRGPRGTGFLFVREEIIGDLHPLSLDLFSAQWTSKDEFSEREDAKKFENFEHSPAGRLGLYNAIKEVNALGQENIWNRVENLGIYFRKKLSEISNIQVTDIGKIKGGIVTLVSPLMSAKDIQNHLHKYDINTVAGVKSGALLDMEKRNLDEFLRASIHYYNTEEEVDKVVSCLHEIVS